MAKQRLFYNRMDSLSGGTPAQIREEINMILLDGWITKMDVLGQVSAAPSATSIVMNSFGLMTNPEVVSELSGEEDYFDLFQEFVSDSNDMLWVHGNPREMPLFLFFTAPEFVVDDSQFSFQKYFRQAVNAGDMLNLWAETAEAKGADTLQALNFNVDVQEIISKYRWDAPRTSSAGFMRTVGFLVGAEAIEKANIVLPCMGYYKNISIQVLYKDFDSTSLPAWIFLGSMLDTEIVNLIAGAVNETAVVPDVGNQGLFMRVDPVLNDAGAILRAYRYHAKDKRIYIGQDKLLKLFSIDLSVSPSSYLLFQADFVPMKGASFKKRFDIGALSEGSNFNNTGEVFRLPLDLDNCQIRVDLTAKYVTTPYAGEVVFRRVAQGDEMVVDTVVSAEGDVLDADFVDQKDFSMHGVLGILPFATASDRLYKEFNTVLVIDNAKAGDWVTWDVNQTGTDDSILGTYNMRFTILGKIPRQGWSECGDFFELDGLVDLNESRFNQAVTEL